MDDLILLSSQLKEDLLNTSECKIKEDVVFRYIAKVEEQNLILPDFPSGLDWFNVSQALEASMLEGKIVVLDFFTYCCINCLHIIPHLRRLEEKYSVENGLIVIGVHSGKFENEKDSGKVLLALNRYNISHPVVNDKDSFLWNKLQICCWPTILVVGPNRKILLSLVGEGHHDELFLFIKTALHYYCSSISSHSLPLLCSDKILTSSILNFPSKIATCQNLCAVSDSGNHRIIICNKEGQIKFIIGGRNPGFEDGSFKEARFHSPQGLVFYNDNKIYIADTENHAIRLACLETLTVTTVVGNGHQGSDYVGGKTGNHQQISSPWDLCIVPCPKPQLPQFSPFNLTPSASPSPVLGSTLPIVPSPSNVPPPPPSLPIVPSPSTAPPPPPSLSIVPPLTPPSPLSLHKSCLSTPGQPSPHVLLIAAAGTHQIWAYFIQEGIWWKGKKYHKDVCIAVAGTGKEENRNNSYPNFASFAQPSGLAYSRHLNAVFIADSESSTIRKLSLQNGSVTHVVGGSKAPHDLFAYGDVDGTSYHAKLQHPLAVAWNHANNLLYVCDTYNHKIKVIDPVTSSCTNLLESTAHELSEPSGCCLSDGGDILYVCDTNNHLIRVIHVRTKEVREFELKEEPRNPVKTTDSNRIWRVEICLGRERSSLNLEVEFYPQNIHGKWRLDLNGTNIEVLNTKGNMANHRMALNFDVPPAKNDLRFQLIFDLVLCGLDTCTFLKPMLQVFIKREENAPSTLHYKVNKNLTSNGPNFPQASP